LLKNSLRGVVAGDFGACGALITGNGSRVKNTFVE
jgi:hypothetical protein